MAGPRSRLEAIEWLRKRFSAESAAGVSLRYQIDLSGEGGGIVHALIDDGRLELGEGAPIDPDVVLGLSAADFFAVLGGSANPDLLYTADRLKIEGDLSLALKLRRLFGRAA